MDSLTRNRNLCRSHWRHIVVSPSQRLMFGYDMSNVRYKNSLPSSTECADTTLTFAQASTSDFSNELDCFCASQSLDSIYHDAPEGLQDLCKQYFLDLMKSRGLTILCSLVIVIINFILQLFSGGKRKFHCCIISNFIHFAKSPTLFAAFS